MKNLKINKEKVISLMLAGSIALGTYGCVRNIKDKKDMPNEETLVTSESMVPEKDLTLYYDLVENHEYMPIKGNNTFKINNGVTMYFLEDDKNIKETVSESEMMVTLLGANYKYALIKLPDGGNYYVDIHALISGININYENYNDILSNNETAISDNTLFYDNDGNVIRCLYENQTCSVVSTNGEYAFITLPDGISGLVLSNVLMNDYQVVDRYAYIAKGIGLYWDSKFTQFNHETYEDQILYIEFVNAEYAGVYDVDGRELLYVKTSELKKNFVDVGLISQRMDCYLDYQLVRSWPTRTGKNSTPTHTGAFDIDWKAADWEFTTYPGSYAKYWIPINEYGEGIHDLVGDDEENYGNQAYQLDGSHGCIRVPREASQFIYENYEVGDMVLVRQR